jgi:RNA polymerase II elongation factor ELL
MNGDSRGKELPNKKLHLDSAPPTPKAKPNLSSASFKRKAAMDHSNAKSAAANTQKVRKIVNGHRSPQTSDSSTDGPALALSWRQSVDMAHKFRRYYDRYVKLYNELAESQEPPSQTRREELMKMHRTLEEMKRQINSGSLGT